VGRGCRYTSGLEYHRRSQGVTGCECTPRAEKKIWGHNLLGKVVGAPQAGKCTPLQAEQEVKFLSTFLVGGEDLERWSGVNLVALACVLRATTEKGRQLFESFSRKKVTNAEKILATPIYQANVLSLRHY